MVLTTALRRELAHYGIASVRRGRILAAVTTAGREFRRRRALHPRQAGVAIPQEDREISRLQPGRWVGPVLDAEPGWRLPASPRDGGDPERLWQHHRFGWALDAVVRTGSRDTARACADAVRNWCRSLAACDARVWDAYSLSERLANWSALARVLWEVDGPAFTDDTLVRRTVDAHAAKLAAAMEDYGDGYTNNHYLNNLRALYAYGTVWNAPAFRSLVRPLLADALPRLFTPSGFLRESSSHYHLLLARTLLEIHAHAELARDPEMMEIVAGWASRASRAAELLLRHGRVPLIGDVSPDAPPEWVAGLLDVAAAVTALFVRAGGEGAGWQTLWTGNRRVPVPVRIPEWDAYPDAGWYRLNRGAVDLLWHVNPDGAVGPRSHGHADLGSFELSWHGIPVVADPGRPSYDATSWDARLASSHSTMTIDGHDPMLAWGTNGYPTAMDRAYWDPRASLEYSDGEAVLRHHGFERLNRGLVVERRFDARPSRLTVTDTIAAACERLVCSYLQLHPEVGVSRAGATRVRLTAAGRPLAAEWIVEQGEIVSFDVLRGDAHDGSGWYSPRYGEQTETHTLRLRVRGTADCRTRLVVEEAVA